MCEIGYCCVAGGKFCNRWCLKIEVATLGHGTNDLSQVLARFDRLNDEGNKDYNECDPLVKR